MKTNKYEDKEFTFDWEIISYKEGVRGCLAKEVTVCPYFIGKQTGRRINLPNITAEVNIPEDDAWQDMLCYYDDITGLSFYKECFKDGYWDEEKLSYLDWYELTDSDREILNLNYIKFFITEIDDDKYINHLFNLIYDEVSNIKDEQFKGIVFTAFDYPYFRTKYKRVYDELKRCNNDIK